MLGEISCQSLLGSKNLIIIILDKRDASLSWTLNSSTLNSPVQSNAQRCRLRPLPQPYLFIRNMDKPLMYWRILAGGCPCCMMACLVLAWFASNWFSSCLLVWSKVSTSLLLGSPRNALWTGVSAVATSEWHRVNLRLASVTLCSLSVICRFSGCNSFCMRWMCSSVIESSSLS